MKFSHQQGTPISYLQARSVIDGNNQASTSVSVSSAPTTSTSVSTTVEYLQSTFSNMTIQDESKTACCSALVAVAKNKAPCLSNTSRMVPDCNYKCVIKSTVEAKISFSVPGDEKQSSEETYNIKATGSYSEVEACVMYGQTSKGKTRSHWGLILQQENHWSMNNHAGRCILFHHLGNGVEIAVGCRGCVRKRVMRVYGNEIPRIRNSSALILDDQKLQSNDF